MPIGGSLRSRAGDLLQRAPCLDDTVRNRTIEHCTPCDEMLPGRLSFGAAHLPRMGPRAREQLQFHNAAEPSERPTRVLASAPVDQKK